MTVWYKSDPFTFESLQVAEGVFTVSVLNLERETLVSGAKSGDLTLIPVTKKHH